jgi:hypothetical protein
MPHPQLPTERMAPLPCQRMPWALDWGLRHHEIDLDARGDMCRLSSHQGCREGKTVAPVLAECW